MRSLALAILVGLGLGVAAPAVASAQSAGYQMNVDDGQGGRSGFWTNRAPAKGGAYRWRLMGIGIGLLALTGGGMLLLVRGAKIARDKRADELKKSA